MELPHPTVEEKSGTWKLLQIRDWTNEIDVRFFGWPGWLGRLAPFIHRNDSSPQLSPATLSPPDLQICRVSPPSHPPHQRPLIAFVFTGANGGSSFTTIAEITRDGSIGQRSSIPHVATMFDCILWAVYYGVSPSGNWVIALINVFGACWMVYYLLKFLQYCEAEDRQNILIFPVAGVHVLAAIFVYYFSNMHAHLLFLSWIWSVWRAIAAVIPLVNMRVLYVHRNMLNMSSLIVRCIALLNAAMWTAFALTGSERNPFIIWPSVVAVISASLQVLVHIVLVPNDDLNEPLH